MCRSSSRSRTGRSSDSGSRVPSASSSPVSAIFVPAGVTRSVNARTTTIRSCSGGCCRPSVRCERTMETAPPRSSRSISSASSSPSRAPPPTDGSSPSAGTGSRPRSALAVRDPGPTSTPPRPSDSNPTSPKRTWSRTASTSEGSIPTASDGLVSQYRLSGSSIASLADSFEPVQPKIVLEEVGDAVLEAVEPCERVLSDRDEEVRRKPAAVHRLRKLARKRAGAVAVVEEILLELIGGDEQVAPSRFSARQHVGERPAGGGSSHVRPSASSTAAPTSTPPPLDAGRRPSCRRRRRRSRVVHFFVLVGPLTEAVGHPGAEQRALADAARTVQKREPRSDEVRCHHLPLGFASPKKEGRRPPTRRMGRAPLYGRSTRTARWAAVAVVVTGLRLCAAVVSASRWRSASRSSSTKSSSRKS